MALREPRQANAGAQASKLGTGLCVYIPPKGSLYSSALIGSNRDTKRSKPIEPVMRMATNTINIALPPAGFSSLVLMHHEQWQYQGLLRSAKKKSLLV
jgi:hypothetical protein